MTRPPKTARRFNRLVRRARHLRIAIAELQTELDWVDEQIVKQDPAVKP